MILMDHCAVSGRDAQTCARVDVERWSGHVGPAAHELSPLAVADDPASRHGQRMARVLQRSTRVIWILPNLQLSTDLLATRARVVALPLRVRRGHGDDPFTAELMDALRCLLERGCLVFVAQGPHPNPLAEVGIPVGAPRYRSHISASEACVVAAESALLRFDSPRRERHG